MAQEELILTDDLLKDIENLEKGVKKFSNSLKELGIESKSLQKDLNKISDVSGTVMKAFIDKAIDKISTVSNLTKGWEQYLENLGKGGTDGIRVLGEVLEKIVNTMNNLKPNTAIKDTIEAQKKDLIAMQNVNGATITTIDPKKESWDFAKNALKENKKDAKSIAGLEEQINHLDIAQENLIGSGKRYEQTITKISDLIDKKKTKIQDLTRTTEKQNQIEEKARKTSLAQEEAYRKAVEASVERFRGTSQGALSFSSNAKTYQEQEQAIKYLTTARENLSKTDSNYEQTLRRLNDEIERNKREMKNATKSSSDLAKEEEQARIQEEKAYQQRRKRILAERELVHKQINESYDGSLRFSDNAKTINDRAKAIENMRKAYKNLDPSVETNKVKMARLNLEIKKQESALRRLQGETAKTSNAMGQWASRLGALFGINAISNFVRKMVTVRGELELQQKSLEVLLKSKSKANKLWEQTMQLAVQSPFQVGQLITYTKQLAAYQIETDKLFDTTKRLADLSAGLGVDMDRLILAYGQVRTAEYLRATEVRQFTEAGVPLLDTLAKRFEALEGKAVSVAEVMERITKRQVTFGDVEAVINQMTDLGGLFYNMQEEQSKTVKGMMSNLKDEISLMFNEIGESSEGVIKDSLQLVRYLVKNWDFFAQQLKIIIPILGLFKIQQLAANFAMQKGVIISKTWGGQILRNAAATKGFGRHLAIFAKTANTAQYAVRGLGMALKSFLPALIITTIIEAVMWLSHLGESINKVQNEFNKIDFSNKTQSFESEKIYKDYAKTITDIASSEKDRQEALVKLKTALGDILPDELLELEYIKSKKGAYEEVTKAMEVYYARKAEEEKKNKVEGEFGSEIDTQLTDLMGDFEDLLLYAPAEFRKRVSLFYEKVFQEVANDVKSGKINPTKIEEEIKKRLAEQTELKSFYQDWSTIMGGQVAKGQSVEVAGYTKNINELTNALTKYSDALELASKSTAKNWTEYLTTTSQDYKDIEISKKALEEIAGLAQEVASGKYTWDQVKENVNKIIANVPNQYTKWIKQYYNELEKLSKEGAFSFTQNWYDVLDNALTELSNKLPNSVGYKQLKEDLTTFYDSNKQTLNSTNLSNIIANNSEFSNYYTKYFKEGQLNRDNLLKGIREDKEAILKEVEELKIAEKTLLSSNMTFLSTALQQFIPTGGIFKRDKNLIDTISREETIELAKKLAEDLGKMEKLLGGSSSKTSGKGAESLLSRRIELIKKMQSEYEKLNDYMSNTTALERVKERFAEAAKELDIDISDIKFATPEDIEKAFRRIKTASKKEKAELEKTIGDIQLDFEIKDAEKKLDVLKSQIDNLFTQYDLTIELQKLDVPPQLMKDLFGLDSTSLSDIRKRIENELSNAKAQGGGNEKIVEALEAEQKKLEEKEKQHLENRLKEYVKFTRNAMSENAKLKYEELKALADIERTFEEAKQGKTDDEKVRIEEAKQQAILGYQKQTTEKMQELQWQAFKNSDMFASIFNDLDTVSDLALSNMITQLENYKEEWSDLPINEMKEVINQIEKMQNAMNKRKALANPFKDTKVYSKQDVETAEHNISSATIENQELTQQIADLEVIIQLENEHKDATAQINAFQEKYNTDLSIGAGIIKSELEDQIIYNDETITQSKNIINNYELQILKLQEQANIYKEIDSQAQKLYDAFKDLSEVLGADDDSAVAIFADMGMSMASTVLQTLALQAELQASTVAAGTFGAAMNTAMGIIGWIVMAVQLITAGLKAAFDAHDNSKQREIEDLQDHIDSLAKSYEELSEAMDMAYSMDRMSNAYRMAQANIQAQKKAIKEQIELEKEKWNTDEEKVKEYEEQLEELDKQSEDLKQQLIDSMGGITDTSSKAREFVDAWVDAFKETGDGLSGLEQNFDEFFDNLIREQISKQVIGSITENFAKEVNEAITNNQGLSGEITEAEWRQLQQSANASKEQMNNAMQMYRQFFEESGAGLSGLQEGIKGITESQADIIASYLNSIRMFVSEKTIHVRDIRNILMGINGQPNPMLDELKRVARHTESIRDLLNRVSDTNTNTLKVSIY